MHGSTRIPENLPARWYAPGAGRAAPEPVEEVWDAELVGDLDAPGWLAVPALASYVRAGRAAPLPRVDRYA